MKILKPWRVLSALLMSVVLAACGGGAGSSPDAQANAADGRKQALAGIAQVSNFTGNGWYWNPAESGTGFMFEAQGDRGFVGFFMYEEATGKPVWYVAEGGAGSFVATGDGSYAFTAELRYFYDGQPAWSTTYVAPKWRSMGMVRMTFTGSNALVVLPGRVQTATRFDFNGLGTATNARQPETGWYWNPGEGGRGWAMEVQNNRLFMAMFHYNLDGTPTWHIVEADIPEGQGTAKLVQYANGQTLTSGYKVGTRQEVGSFSVSFRNPCAGQLQLAGAVAVGVRRFSFGGLPAGDECKAVATATTDLVPGLEAGPVRMAPGDAVYGRIDSSGDTDVYGIALVAGVAYEFNLQGAPSARGSLTDPVLRLYNGQLVKLQENNNISPSQLEARLTFTPTTSGTYYLAASANGTGTGSFLLSASGLASDLIASPLLPADSLVGSLSATMSGRLAGTLTATINVSHQVIGTLVLSTTGATLAVSGTVADGGVLSMTATGTAGPFTFAGVVSPTGEVSGTWTGASVPGGLLFGTTNALASAPPSVLTVRARASLLGGMGATMIVRLNGVPLGTVTVQATEPTDYTFPVATLVAGDKVDVVFTNDAATSSEDRNLYVHYLTYGTTTLIPTATGAIIDRGTGSAATDGIDTLAGGGDILWNGALRLTWPATSTPDLGLQRKYEVVRLLQQATFGATASEVARAAQMTDAAWVDEQLSAPATTDYVSYVQGYFSLGSGYRPGGSSYDPTWNVRRFWSSASEDRGQLRKRTAFALHQIFMVSQADSNIWSHARGYANYLDKLNKRAFGNFRDLLEDMALDPMMGIYLSHMRNRPEDSVSGRLPDENFAREVMQLFTIGLYELNLDGTLKLDSNGRAVETYNNNDVMAMAKVFTGWSWAFPDGQLTETNFRFGSPSLAVNTDAQIDLLPMKAYPGQHSTSAKSLFASKPWATIIPANTTAQESLKRALDVLFNHPNVGPFIGRQLIQHLTTSNPSPSYVARVAAVFNDNGRGVRGDLGAVVRAILLDVEARRVPDTGFGKLREPVLRVSQWLRGMSATSVSGNFMMAYDLDDLSQRPLHSPSVFGYFRPGYVPPNSSLSAANATAPEFQLVSESTTSAWVNLAEEMAGGGIGWNGTSRDVVPNLDALTNLSTSGDIGALVQHLNLVLFAGRMPPALRQDILDAVTGVSGSDANSHRNRARVAVFMALTSPEFLVQR